MARGVQRWMWAEGEHQVTLLIFGPRDGALGDAALQALPQVRSELQQGLATLDAKQAGSMISAVNNNAEPLVILPPQLFDALTQAKHIAERSQGAYNPNAGRLYQLWAFAKQGRVPAAQAIQGALNELESQTMTLDPSTHTLLHNAPLSLDLGPMALGLALDKAAQKLQQLGQQNFVLQVDAQVVMHGCKGSQAWTLGIQDPRGAEPFASLTGPACLTAKAAPQVNSPTAAQQPAPNSTMAVATVSDNQRFFWQQKTRFHDVIDPRSGQPGRLCRSATVTGPQAAQAAALAFALFNLGPKTGLKLIAEYRGYQALVVDARNQVWISVGLQSKVAHRPPTDAP